MITKESVCAELVELKNRLRKLESFMKDTTDYNGLTEAKQDLLFAQADTMRIYITILELRIENWGESTRQQMIEKSEAEFLPECPYCRCDVQQTVYREGFDDPKFRVECPECTLHTAYYPDEQMAIDDWKAFCRKIPQ